MRSQVDRIQFSPNSNSYLRAKQDWLITSLHIHTTHSEKNKNDHIGYEEILWENHRIDQ